MSLSSTEGSHSAATRIPVTLIGGFLGAGKTTLLNHLVTHADRRFGIIVNEFGDAGIDGSLIENVDSDGVAELTNGCLCCFGRDDLVGAMLKLAEREDSPDYVLIELSGIADPVPVAQTVLDPFVRGLFELDGILGVADGRNLERTLHETPEGAVQLAYAQQIILNKTDLVSPAALEHARTLLGRLNPLAEVIEASFGHVAPANVLGQGLFDTEKPLPISRTEHTKQLGSVTLTSDAPLDRDAFNRFAETQLLSAPERIYRAKGYLAIAGLEQTLLFQSVREVFTLTPSEHPNEGRSQLVVIGRQLDKDTLRSEFEKTQQRAQGLLHRLLQR